VFAVIELPAVFSASLLHARSEIAKAVTKSRFMILVLDDVKIS
jgi:hypothetical protein